MLVKSNNDKIAKEAVKINAMNEKWSAAQEKEENRIQMIKDSLPNINCFGDSLTYGVGGNGITYPSILLEKTKLNVFNYGMGGETSYQIACRQGAIPVYVKDFTIPEKVAPVEVSLIDKNESIVKIGDAGVNPCTINNIEGNLSYRADTDKYYFTRLKDGKKTFITDKTQLITFATKNKNKNDILIIFSGSNDGLKIKTIKNLIETQKKMIKFANTDKYIIIGLTSKYYIQDIEKINNALSKEYGDKFLDIRKYLLGNALNDAGLTPTTQDKKDIKNGEIPVSLRTDYIHGNNYFYNLLGNQVNKKILELGYLNHDQLNYLGVDKNTQ
jgi:lysophospholipase L1-like esterase